MSFDEQPDGDPHGECKAEIDRLMRIVRAAKILYFESEEYDLPDGMGRGVVQQYWDDLADAIEGDDAQHPTIPRNMEGPEELCPKPAQGFGVDSRGVLVRTK